MAKTIKLLVLAGDGIGPEVMSEVGRVIDWFGRRRQLKFDIEPGLIGGAALDAEGTPLSDTTLALAQSADAVLLGAVGGPKWEKLPFDKRPERGLLRIRKELGLFANLRPAIMFDALADGSPLKPEVVKGLDLVIIRELTGGLYFGEPRGIDSPRPGVRRGTNTQVYSTPEIERVARVAFELARTRRNAVCSIDKANVLESSVLWREEVQALHDRDYPDVALTHMYVDNCAMQLVRNPKAFDVVLTDNMFGDILSDEASMLTGSLGMLPSASLGAAGPDGRRPALYEPVHGSAPDIAGQGIANPLAAILSFAMALRYSFGLEKEAQEVERAVKGVLAGGMRTADIMQPGKAKVSTAVMGESVIKELERAGG